LPFLIHMYFIKELYTFFYKKTNPTNDKSGLLNFLKNIIPMTIGLIINSKLQRIAEGDESMKEKIKVAFICVHNSCRSQMAEALGKHFAKDVFESHFCWNRDQIADKSRCGQDHPTTIQH